MEREAWEHLPLNSESEGGGVGASSPKLRGWRGRRGASSPKLRGRRERCGSAQTPMMKGEVWEHLRLNSEDGGSKLRISGRGRCGIMLGIHNNWDGEVWALKLVKTYYTAFTETATRCS